MESRLRQQLRTDAKYILVILGALFFLAGLSITTFVRAEGLSYLSNDPQACVNCHVMRDQFDAWEHSSHARVAACNDCHSPHNNEINRYYSKARNGFNHSLAFTLGSYGEVITITQYNEDIVNGNCMGCHNDMVSQIAPDHDNAPNCISCHTGIGHPVRE